MYRFTWITILAAVMIASHAFAAEEPSDFTRFPNMMHFLKTVVTDRTGPPPAGNEHLMHATKVFHTSQELWDRFFKAAIADKLTNLRAFGLLGREIKTRGLTVYGPGQGFEQAVIDNHVDLGLAIPAKHLGFGVWEPDAAIKDPEFQVHLSVIYKERFIHQFPDEVLPANLRIGTGDQVDYYIDGEKHRGYLMTADLYYGPGGIGFKNVQGIGGEKRGLLGFVQKMLFFLPDAISSMVIDERKNVMLTEAVINTTVENFETRDIYRIRYRN